MWAVRRRKGKEAYELQALSSYGGRQREPHGEQRTFRDDRDGSAGPDIVPESGAWLYGTPRGERVRSCSYEQLGGRP